MIKPNSNTPCPCQSSSENPVNYAVCCGRYHKGKIHAPTAEALMRSRYTAYVVGNAQYLYRTWHEKTRPSLQSLRDSGPQDLISLKILSTQEGGINDQKGMVEFVSSYDNDNADAEPDEQILQHKEKSLFVRVKNRWVYIDAV